MQTGRTVPHTEKIERSVFNGAAGKVESVGYLAKLHIVTHCYLYKWQWIGDPGRVGQSTMQRRWIEKGPHGGNVDNDCYRKQLASCPTVRRRRPTRISNHPCVALENVGWWSRVVLMSVTLPNGHWLSKKTSAVNKFYERKSFWFWMTRFLWWPISSHPMCSKKMF